MALAGTKSQGYRVYIGTKAADGATDTYTQIKRCKVVGEFGAEAQIIDATTLEDSVRQKLKGIPDSGDVELSGNRVYTDAGQTALLAAAEDTDDDPYNFRLEADGVGASSANLRWSFKALASKFKTKPGQVDGLQEFSAMVAITGAVTQSTVA